MTRLRQLHYLRTAMLPSARLCDAASRLVVLDLSDCGASLVELPAYIGGLSALRQLDLSGCSALAELPVRLYTCQ